MENAGLGPAGFARFRGAFPGEDERPPSKERPRCKNFARIRTISLLFTFYVLTVPGRPIPAVRLNG